MGSNPTLSAIYPVIKRLAGRFVCMYAILYIITGSVGIDGTGPELKAAHLAAVCHKLTARTATQILLFFADAPLLKLPTASLLRTGF